MDASLKNLKKSHFLLHKAPPKTLLVHSIHLSNFAGLTDKGLAEITRMTIPFAETVVFGSIQPYALFFLVLVIWLSLHPRLVGWSLAIAVPNKGFIGRFCGEITKTTHQS